MSRKYIIGVMQQYFTDVSLHKGDVEKLDKESLRHLKVVLRKDEDYVFRMADRDGKIFLSHLKDDSYEIIEELDEDNELSVKITVVFSLIKPDRFEWGLQKLTELGASRIVPFVARRSVIRKEGKNTLERYRKICREAAEQSHRNYIPEVTEYTSMKDLKDYLSDVNILAYEKEDPHVREIPLSGRTVTLFIGPEGGLTEEEVSELKELGFSSVSLGKRILRAETAAVYLTSIVGERVR